MCFPRGIHNDAGIIIHYIVLLKRAEIMKFSQAIPWVLFAAGRQNGRQFFFNFLSLSSYALTINILCNHISQNFLQQN